MEACGGAHHWARKLMEMEHQVKLMLVEFVKAFNIHNKNDAADARAEQWAGLTTLDDQIAAIERRMREWK